MDFWTALGITWSIQGRQGESRVFLVSASVCVQRKFPGCNFGAGGGWGSQGPEVGAGCLGLVLGHCQLCFRHWKDEGGVVTWDRQGLGGVLHGEEEWHVEEPRSCCLPSHGTSACAGGRMGHLPHSLHPPAGWAPWNVCDSVYTRLKLCCAVHWWHWFFCTLRQYIVQTSYQNILEPTHNFS